jgi:hypothetical protein
MTVNSQRLLLAAAGAAAAGEALYVDDVFSTYLYDGNNTLRSIQNGIDLSGEGGLVWIKNRDSGTQDHVWCDTERGAGKIIESNNNNAEFTSTARVDSFLSDGFKVGTDNATNQGTSGLTSICSWTFRKAPGFFDVVTWTGNGTAGRTVAHDLGSVPGCIMIKCLSHAEAWVVFHRSLGATTALRLNLTQAKQDETFWFNDTAPTSSEFTLGNSGSVNDPGRTYVAYLFAHDDQSFGEDEDESIIKCGTFTTDGSYNGTVTLGWEPQWVMVKNSSATGGWFIHDVMRGAPVSGDNNWLYANTNGAETTSSVAIRPNPTGFTSFNHSASTDMIYVAIRRPHKPPEAGTDVFAIDTLGGTSPSPPGWTSGFPVDWEFIHKDNATSQWESITRLTNKLLYLNLNNAESALSSSNDTFDHMTGWSDSTATNANNFSWMFRRAAGFFDVVTYAGNGNNAQTLNHNLAVAPEFYFVKNRDAAKKWAVYHTQLVTDSRVVYLNENASYSTSWTPDFVNPTATQFTVSQEMGGVSVVNASGNDHIAYLFATLSGISKVGSYTGTGSNIGVDCGFTAGARFVLIKRIDGTGDWYVYDSTRGIVGGNDPYLLINSTAAEVTNTDYIDPLNSGFTVTSSAPAALNASGGTYIFLAIA